MIKFKCMLLGIALLSSVAVNAQNLTYIVNGVFFRELPESIKKAKTEDLKMFSISTPDKSRALALYSQSLPITEDVAKYTIPVDSVAEGRELLRRYYEMVEESKEPRSYETSIKVGDKFPTFKAVDIDGKEWTNADAEGKVMVLNLWFTGCGPCRAEMPELSEWKNEMSDVMFFSSTYEAPEVARKVLDKVNFNWIPLVSDIQFKKFISAKGYPMTIIVDKNGVIAKIEEGTSVEKRAELKKAIQSLR